jgi:hypothetical protein
MFEGVSFKFQYRCEREGVSTVNVNHPLAAISCMERSNA